MDLFKSISAITLILSFTFIPLGLYMPCLLDNFLTNEIQQRLPLTNGSMSTQQWSNPDVPIFIKFFFFNITNPEEFQSGEKPHFKEIGPFTFSQKRWNVIRRWNSDETMFDYETFRSYHFEPHLSSSDLETRMTLLNFPLVALAKIVSDKTSLFKKTVGSIIKKHGGGLFLNLTVGQVLFEGFEIPLIKKISGISRQLNVPLPDRFGIMYGRNGTSNGIFSAFTGKDDVKKLLLMHRWNDERTVNCWSDQKCGLINGTDGTWFHPMLSRGERLYIFNAEMNRSIFLDYSGDSSVHGLSTYHFTASQDLLRSPTVSQSNNCFCVNNDTTLSESGFCSLDGILDISNCNQGAPLVLSLPHFLYGDPLLIQSTQGLNPSLNNHQSYLDVEPLTGIVLEARRRIQFNLRLKYDYDLGGRPFRDMVYPLLWLEEGADLPKEKADQLNEQIFYKIFAAEMISISFIILGIGLIIFSVFVCSWPYISKKFVSKYKERIQKEKNVGYTYLGLHENSVKPSEQ